MSYNFTITILKGWIMEETYTFEQALQLMVTEGKIFYATKYPNILYRFSGRTVQGTPILEYSFADQGLEWRQVSDIDNEDRSDIYVEVA